MKATGKNNSGIYTFLAPYLVAGDEAAIAKARKEYRRQYKANWKQQKRKQQKTVELFFTKNEWEIIRCNAGEYHRSYTGFVKDAAMAYCNKTYLVRDIIEYNEVREALLMVYARLKNMEDNKTVSIHSVNELLYVFQAVQQTIAQYLQYPQTLEETIIAAIQANPVYKETLQNLLQNIS